MTTPISASSSQPRLTIGRAFRALERIGHQLFHSKMTQTLIDGAIVGATLLMAYLIRFDGNIPPLYRSQFLFVISFTILLYVAMNYIWGVYGLVWHFIGYKDSGTIAMSLSCSVLLFFALNIIWGETLSHTRIPFGVALLHPMLIYMGWIVTRALWRIVYYHGPSRKSLSQENTKGKRLLLAGAGEAGLLLLSELSKRPELAIVGFLDDSPELRGRTIKGYPVLGSTQDLEPVIRRCQIDEVILSMPSVSHAVVSKLAARCQELGVKISTVPTLSEIVLGKVNISRLRTVQMEQLLGRESVHYRPNEHLITTFQGRRILVTGAGGSIGSELSRQLAAFSPSQLILLDKDENSLYEVSLELQDDFPNIIPIIANIRDCSRTEKIYRDWSPEVVFHAAAYKHVPLMEDYPREAVLNNIIGTRDVIDLSSKYKVKIFVLISTDKAINPTSIMGATKRVAELIVQQRASYNVEARYCCVRFGNVLGSRASVVPLFQRQIRQGKNITVTHPEMQRYFMTIPEAVQLVIQAGSLGRRGEIFLLDMGDPVKIVDLARNLIELSGLVPDQDVKIVYTGLRAGEKLYEELFGDHADAIRTTEYPKIFVVKEPFHDHLSLDQYLRELENAAYSDDICSIQGVLKALNIGYKPEGSSLPKLPHCS
jgi:FlaA1/EpsC-like NDP-sugar epimerase